MNVAHNRIIIAQITLDISGHFFVNILGRKRHQQTLTQRRRYQ